METGKLLILFKYVGVVQQALPLRVCRQVKDSKLAAAGLQAEGCCCGRADRHK